MELFALLWSADFLLDGGLGMFFRLFRLYKLPRNRRSINGPSPTLFSHLYALLWLGQSIRLSRRPDFSIALLYALTAESPQLILLFTRGVRW